MLFGFAQSLARELNVQTPRRHCVPPHQTQTAESWLSQLRIRYRNRRRRVQSLLIVFNNQILSGFGGVPTQGPTPNPTEIEDVNDGVEHHGAQNTWIKALALWTKLVKVCQTFNDILFGPPDAIARVVEDRAYVKWLQHSESLLKAWHREFEDSICTLARTGAYAIHFS